MTDYIKNTLPSLYGKSRLDYQIQRYENATAEFEKLYSEKNYEYFSSPARTEIGGNQVDHNGGKVMAGAVDIDMIAVCAKTDDKIIKIKSQGYDAFEVDLNLFAQLALEKGSPSSLVRGIASAIKSRGYDVGGFCAYITSDVKEGSGLSSSASFEMLIAAIINHFYCGSRLSPTDLAKAGKYAENTFFGKASGLMDQMACAVGGFAGIDFSKTVSPEVHKILFNLENTGYTLCVVDTKSSHAGMTDEYESIPKDMKKIAGFFSKESLCELSRNDILSNINELREYCGDRAVLRAIHFFDENERVEEMMFCLKAKNFEGFLEAVRASGSSSYKLLQNVIPSEQAGNQALALALYLTENFLLGKGACRVHGGGFGGTIQSYIPSERFNDYTALMEKVFGKGCVYELKIRPQGAIKL